MQEVEISGKTFVLEKLNVFDQQFVLGKFAKVFVDVANAIKENKSEQEAFFVLQEGFSNLGRETFKEVATLLLSKVKYKQKVSDNVSASTVSIMTAGGGFQFDWIENDITLFQALLARAFFANFDSFLGTKGN